MSADKLFEILEKKEMTKLRNKRRFVYDKEIKSRGIQRTN